MLEPDPEESYLDLTAGYGGHAAAILSSTGAPEKAVLVDRDNEAAAYLKQRFAGTALRIIRSDFKSASEKLVGEGRQFDMILADLGASSPHFDKASRGFAISAEGPLDMRMDRSQELSADTIVNGWSEQQLAETISEYGEEPKARQIARRIVAARPVKSTGELARIIAGVWPGRSRLHPATRTFQALRIVVNDELGQLQASLPLWLELLAPGGRLAVISFHSLEDRIVKKFLMDYSGDRYDAQLRLLTKNPVTASPIENVSNPRARSAKLRAAAKINTQKGQEDKLHADKSA